MHGGVETLAQSMVAVAGVSNSAVAAACEHPREEVSHVEGKRGRLLNISLHSAFSDRLAAEGGAVAQLTCV